MYKKAYVPSVQVEKQEATKFNHLDLTESCECPFCNTLNIGKHDKQFENEFNVCKIDLVTVCKHFAGFYEGYGQPVAYFKSLVRGK